MLQTDAVGAEHTAHAARNFDRHGHVGPLAKTDLGGQQSARILQAAELVRQQLRLGNSLQRIDELVLRQLKRGDRPAELLAHTRILQRCLIARHRGSHRAEDDAEPRLIQRRQRTAQTLHPG